MYVRSRNLNKSPVSLHHFKLLSSLACIAYMRPIATCVARSVVCVSVLMGPSKHVLDGVPDPQAEWVILRVVGPSEKRWESAAVCAKTDEPIDMPFGGGMLTHLCPRKHVLDWVKVGQSIRCLEG